MTDNPFDVGYREPETTPFEFGEPSPKVSAKEKPASAYVHIHEKLIQGSEEWHAARCGLLTASEMDRIITPKKLELSASGKGAHLHELLAQRITKYVEPTYIGDKMLRGHEDEIEACIEYGRKYGPVDQVGFITNNRHGFTLGFSPDGKVIGANAGIENKSRDQKFQVETIINDEMPVDYVLQVQTGLIVAEWDWIDFNSYSGGLPMATIRIYPDPVVQDAIINVAGEFERLLSAKLAAYHERLADKDARLIPTKRRIVQEMYL